MRWFIILLSFIAILGFGGYVFYIASERPAPVLFDAWQNSLSRLRMERLQGSLRTERIDYSGSGFVSNPWISFSGYVDASDLSHIRAEGIVGYSETAQEQDFETADFILNDQKIVFHLRDVKDERAKWFAESVNTSTDMLSETWLSIDKATLFEEKDLSALIAFGKKGEMESVLKEIGKTEGLFAIQSVEGFTTKGREYYRYTVTANEALLSTALLSFYASWKAKTPTEQDIRWSRRVARGFSEGTWKITVDRKAKIITAITGAWPMKDDSNSVNGRGWIELQFSGIWPQQKQLTSPDNVVDITEVILPVIDSGLPQAIDRPILEEDEENE